MDDRYQITKNWLRHYTGMSLDEFGDYILLSHFIERFGCDILGIYRRYRKVLITSASHKVGK